MDLNVFSKLEFSPALHTFFEKLNIPINHVADEPTTAKEILKDTYKDNDTFNLTNDVYFVGMVDDNAFDNKKESIELDTIKKDYDGILIFGVTLHNRPNELLPTRTQLADITRAFNREFYYTPVVVVFKYNNHIAFANTERLKYKQEWREGEKAGKVTLLRDVNIYKPHAGHQRILSELKIPTSGNNAVDSFAKLYTYWQEVLSANILNKKFYQELSNWYFWAIQNVQFPGKPTFEDAIQNNKELEDLIQEHKATNVIRMLTRLLFVWFLKEKKLIPDELFDLKALQEDILNDIDPIKSNGFFKEQNTESVYYKAILQNLFFATLNCPIESDSIDKRKRGFRLANSNYGTMFLMRYEKHFKDKDGFLAMVNKTVPFLNGGLFECLDERGEGEKRDERKWIDGFSDNLPKDQQLVVPDYLFFGLEEQADLSDVVGIDTREYKQAAVKGLINILESYKFTIAENTPIEEDVALDPELLGKVFENLLASYNPETKTTARKQTGSFYTPREIVNYMVDESLIAYLSNVLEASINVLEASSFEKDNPSVLEASSFERTTSIPKQDASGTLIPKQDASGTLIPKQNASGTVGSQSKDASGTFQSGTFQATFLDPNSEIEIKQGLLPHWQQDNVIYFVTFRLADSIPSEKQEELKNDREKWNKNKKDKKDFTKEEWKEYNRLFNNRVEEWLNAGYGSCLLRKPENASIVANALKYFDNQRYFLDEWVVMPNHVHVLVKPIGENKITDILHSWKSYTANEINKKEGRKGNLWMRESYDHIVRNEDALKHIRHYIRQNPTKAGIDVLEASINVLEASSFEKDNPTVLEASSFERTTSNPKQDASGTSNSKQDASGTLRQLVSFDPINPFIDNQELTKKIITALNSCTIIDPACGSGAFPMGILQKMVHILQKLDPNNKIWKEVQREKANVESEEAFDKVEDKDARAQRLIEINEAFDESINDPDYARKLFLIENCIYGVDIQPIATQISKLRFFISLVVEQKVNPEKENFGIRPLPNLETKFISANTLIGIDRPKKGDQLNMFNTETLKELETKLKIVRSKLFSAKTKETKVKYRNRDEALRKAIATELQQNGWESDTAQKLASWDPYDQNASSSFFDPEWMFDIKEGFDVVIGNPPYVSIKDIEKNFKEYLKIKYETAKGQFDLYSCFMEFGIKLLSQNGNLSFITSNTFLSNKDFKKLRVFLLSKTQIRSLVNLDENVFETAQVDVAIINITNGFKTENKIKVYPNRNYFINNKYELVSQSYYNNENNNFEIRANLRACDMFIIDKIDSQDNILGDFINLPRGIEIGGNSKLILKEKVNMNWVPILVGKNVSQFKVNFNNLFVEFDENDKSNFKDRTIYEQPKILIQRIRNLSLKQRIVSTLDVNNFYCTNTIRIGIPKNLHSKSLLQLKSLVAILNSSVVNFYFSRLFINKDIYSYQLQRIPIPNYNIESSIFKLVDCLLFEYDEKFLQILNSSVLNLYFPKHMKERNIDILELVEEDIEKAMLNRDFEKISNEEKERVIKQLHNTWTDPNNEVVKRIGMFREKSPDLLGVILDS